MKGDVRGFKSGSAPGWRLQVTSPKDPRAHWASVGFLWNCLRAAAGLACLSQRLCLADGMDNVQVDV